MQFISKTLILLFLISSCHVANTNNLPLTFQAKVTAIKDGDTYKVVYNSRELTIRLANIDCPEKKQPFSTQAKLFASGLCFGKEVTVKTEGKTDRYKRIIGEIILPDGTNVNKELVKNGLAWHFKKYSTSSEYAELETAARQQRIGLWSDSLPIPPWNWRHKSNNVRAELTITITPSPDLPFASKNYHRYNWQNLHVYI